MIDVDLYMPFDQAQTLLVDFSGAQGIAAALRRPGEGVDYLAEIVIQIRIALGVEEVATIR